MEFSVLVFGIKFTFEEAQKLAEAPLGAIDKDYKNRVYICILLDFTLKFLQDWYNEAQRAMQPAAERKGFKDLAPEQMRGGT